MIHIYGSWAQAQRRKSLLRNQLSLSIPLLALLIGITRGFVCPLAAVAVTCTRCSSPCSTTRKKESLLLFLTPNDWDGTARRRRRRRRRGNEPYVTWIDPTTNVTVVVLGCLHGSPSSTADLEYILTQTHPEALVLELCTTRYLTLVKQQQQNLKIKEALYYATTTEDKRKSSITGIASIILGIATEFQTTFSGFEPGLEFVS